MLLDLWDYIVSVFDLLNANLLFNVAFLLCIGIIGGNLAEKIKLPRVTGYILVGMLFGPSVFGLIDAEFLYDIKIIKVLTLGFIGFNIGMELNRTILKSKGSRILFITFFQALFTFALVFLAVYFVAREHKLTYALILGSIATVTTPAPIVACMRSYHTRGSISEFVCPIVAIDDMIGIVIFSLALPFSIYFAGHEGELLVAREVFLGPILSIAFSFVVGGILGILMTKILKYYKNSDNITIVLIIFIAVVLGVSIGEVFETSDILLPLVMGMVMSNGISSELLEKFRSNTDAIVLPLLLVFFTISGADLKFESMGIIGGLALIYIIVRIVGKVAGTHLAARISKENSMIQKYLGFTLIPQGGVALDMAILAEVRFAQVFTDTGEAWYGELGTNIFSIILSAIIFYKLIGEIVVKWSFKKAGEIDIEEEEQLHSKPHAI